MICPNCKAEYTSANPCHCDTLELTPPPAAADRKPAPGPDPQPPALAPTGINNPFWH
jgi:hypothetical protein